MRSRWAAATLAVTAGLTLAAALRAPASGPDAVPGRAPSVAVWSARRLPILLADQAGAMQLPQRLDAALSGTAACFLLAEHGTLVHARDAHEPLIPASTQKLLVAAAALSVLGPDHRFVTRVVADGPPASGRVGRLWVVGGGDPVLAESAYGAFLARQPLTALHPVTSLETLADRVASGGVREVTGGVFGDASRHQGAATVPTWKSSYIRDHDVSYLSALTVNGGWSAWDPVKVTAPDPARQTAARFAEALITRGVTVAGEPTRGTAPAGGHLVAEIESPPLSQIVEALLRESDNLIAETLVREVGLARVGVGDTPEGVDAVVAALADAGVDVEGVSLVDGSGLDRGNRATCASTMGALELRERPGFGAIDSGLAVAGETGTLYRRLEGTALEGRLRAKTGSLNDVVGLVGVLDGPLTLTFALLANGKFASAGGAAIQDDVAVTLHRYPFTFDEPELLAPPPARPVRAPSGSDATSG